jgi:hypothetical protein
VADIAFHVLPLLLGKMRAFPLTDYLLDIGTLPNYQKAQITGPGNGGSAVLPDQSAGQARGMPRTEGHRSGAGRIVRGQNS